MLQMSGEQICFQVPPLFWSQIIQDTVEPSSLSQKIDVKAHILVISNQITQLDEDLNSSL